MQRHTSSVGRIDYLSLILVTVTVSIVVWVFPLILGKYSDLTYPYIASDKILDEVVPLVRSSDDDGASLPLCPIVSPHLKGLQLEVNLGSENLTEKEMQSIAKEFGVMPGGVWKPSHCTSRYAVS